VLESGRLAFLEHMFSAVTENGLELIYVGLYIIRTIFGEWAVGVPGLACRRQRRRARTRPPRVYWTTAPRFSLYASFSACVALAQTMSNIPWLAVGHCCPALRFLEEERGGRSPRNQGSQLLVMAEAVVRGGDLHAFAFAGEHGKTARRIGLLGTFFCSTLRGVDLAANFGGRPDGLAGRRCHHDINAVHATGRHSYGGRRRGWLESGEAPAPLLC